MLGRLRLLSLVAVQTEEVGLVGWRQQAACSPGRGGTRGSWTKGTRSGGSAETAAASLSTLGETLGLLAGLFSGESSERCRAAQR